jgi:hypothetical protein
MAFPKQIKKTLDLVPDKILSERRRELAEYITKDGTYLPKSVLHADLDRGMLDFVKNELQITSEGKIVPMVDILLTTQNWSQFTETWSFVDTDFNAKPPFITVVRQPEVKYGTNPSLLYTIPNRKQFYFAVVPTWNGNQKGADVYTIPQPVPVDINYSVKIICNRMRELNQFNKVVLQKFSSRQAYTFIKGQYVPIVSTNISDESVMDIDKRKYYIQNYDFTMLGYLIDEEEFEVKPAISRALQIFEVDTNTKKKKPEPKEPQNKSYFNLSFNYEPYQTSYSLTMDYTVDMTLESSENIESYDVYINGDFYGTGINQIPINTNDYLSIDITVIDDTKPSVLNFANVLV